MRMLIITLLAGATLATPLAAQDRPERGDHDGHVRGERAPQAEQAQQQPQQQQRPQPNPGRQADGGRPAADYHAARPDGAGGGRYRGGEAPVNAAPPPVARQDLGNRGDPRAPGNPGAAAAPRNYGYRGDPRGDRNAGGGLQQRDYGYRGDPGANRNPGAAVAPRDYAPRGDRNPGALPPRDFGGRPGAGYQQRDYGNRGDPRQGFGDARGGGQWNRDWRSDRRYDWQGRRAADRARFHAPRYAAPRGYDYGYRRWSVGVRLAPLFFGAGYWLGDADYYGLPPAYGPYRWVRYYDDVLLVDVRTGYVADVIYGFFW